MKPEEAPFPTAWWGTDLEEAGLAEFRPRISTYGRYDFSLLPPLPCELDSGFAWLSGAPRYQGHIGERRADENTRAIRALSKSAGHQGVATPPEFLKFMMTGSLHEHIRSNTDCYLNVCSSLVPSPIGDGSLVRFLADSQGCLFWYLYLPVGDVGHAVVASSGFYGTAEEKWQDEPPDPAELVFVAESFETFLCRFWIENEIWFAGYEQHPIPEIGKSYVAAYRARGQRRV